ncbi:MAG: serine/threonine-protein phosphatase, partial [Anaerolineales bacterium]|nr:serine/threonine-protein phosphatase [Anaerolineales bacterium]
MSKTMAIPPKNNNHSLVFGTHYAVGGRANLEDRVAARHIQTAGGLPLTVAMVADGMGGHNAGEVAAQLTVNTVYEALENSPIATPQQIPEALAQALAYANQVVYEAARTDENKRGMGTTATVAAVHNGRLYLAHVGDSRAYLVRNGRARQITQDHTWGREMLRRGVLSTQEIAKHPKANELYSSIGYET